MSVEIVVVFDGLGKDKYHTTYMRFLILKNSQEVDRFLFPLDFFMQDEEKLFQELHDQGLTDVRKKNVRKNLIKSLLWELNHFDDDEIFEVRFPTSKRKRIDIEYVDNSRWKKYFH